MHARGWALVAVVALAALAGCSGPIFDSGPQSDEGDAGAADRNLTDGEIGLVDGYRYDARIDVDGSDGLGDAELDAVVARAMARVERERGLNFERTVPVDVVSREQYRDESAGMFGSYDEVDRIAWRASFVVGDDGNVTEAYDELYSSSVAGYYTSRDGGKIVIVSDHPEAVRIDRSTLVHELVHALQDQRHGIARQTETRDERLAWNGLLEGEANYLMERYENNCAEGEFECVAIDGRGSGASASESLNYGLYMTTFLPYSDGPTFVEALYERGGWDAVDRAYDDPPTSATQIIHPGRYPDDPPRNVTVPDRSRGSWERFANGDGAARTERIGEASLFAGLWSNGVIPRNHALITTDGSTYDYSHAETTGWDGDVVVPYRDGEGRTGYVLRTAWTDASEAAEFADAYDRLLGTQDATEVSAGVYTVPESAPFTGAYRVTRTDDVVTVVHAPTVDALDSIHAPRATAEPSVRAAGDGSTAASASPANG